MINPECPVHCEGARVCICPTEPEDKLMAGSAKTGGEKAHNCPVCEYMKRINAKKAAESREPEKLNNAQKCECGHPRDEHALVTGACANAVNHGSGKPLEWCKCKEFRMALAESSLSSPPPDDELLRSMAEKTARRVGLCFGTEQYERESDLVQATNAVFRTLVRVRDRVASPELLPTHKNGDVK
jgi:hypothetical protein